jgi:hypothetical protein
MPLNGHQNISESHFRIVWANRLNYWWTPCRSHAVLLHPSHWSGLQSHAHQFSPLWVWDSLRALPPSPWSQGKPVTTCTPVLISETGCRDQLLSAVRISDQQKLEATKTRAPPGRCRVAWTHKLIRTGALIPDQIDPGWTWGRWMRMGRQSRHCHLNLSCPKRRDLLGPYVISSYKRSSESNF